jgi:hypothetical protein
MKFVIYKNYSEMRGQQNIKNLLTVSIFRVSLMLIHY